MPEFPQPLIDEEFEFEDAIGDPHHCRIRLYTSRQVKGGLVIIATEYTHDDRPPKMKLHTDEIATDFRRLHNLVHRPFNWIEHYDDSPSEAALTFGRPDSSSHEAFYFIDFQARHSHLHSPNRTPISRENVIALIQGAEV